MGSVGNQIINFATKMLGNFDCRCQRGAAAVFPAVCVPFAEAQRLDDRCDTFTILNAEICESLPKVQKNAPLFRFSIDESALL